MTGAKHSINAFMHNKALEGVAGLNNDAKKLKKEVPDARPMKVKTEVKAESPSVGKRKPSSSPRVTGPVVKTRKVVLRPDFDLTTAADELELILKFLGITSEELLKTSFPTLSRTLKSR